MPRGRYFFGPGFWKWGYGWFPGAGGFHGGAYHPWWWGYAPPADLSYYPPWPGYAAPSSQDEAEFLKSQAAALKQELDMIQQRLKELEDSD